jgi:hypothetical protein
VEVDVGAGGAVDSAGALPVDSWVVVSAADCDVAASAVDCDALVEAALAAD